MGRGVTIVLGAAVCLLALGGSTGQPAGAAVASPIHHIVIIYQENNSFDELLGGLCVHDQRCVSVTSGKTSTGLTVPLKAAPDVVPWVDHSNHSQKLAMDGGKMDGFNLIGSCGASTNYRCYIQYQPSQIPNLAALARRFAISDHTFEIGSTPSWGAHLDLVAGSLLGFTGDNPVHASGYPGAPGWGCDSYRDAVWHSPSGAWLHVPSCIPKQDGSGPYKPSPVPWSPTIMDRLSGAGLTWKMYAATYADGGPPYGWAICPTFADCLDTPQKANMLPTTQAIADLKAGKLASVTYIMPSGAKSQHNGNSMLLGDNWIGSVVSAIENGPHWSDTAIFITYDDCGCFYDHVAPPAGLGVRVPMVIVSPYARSGYTDSSTASFASPWRISSTRSA